MLSKFRHSAGVSINEIYEMFGRRLAAVRDSSGMTQTDLAKLIGLSRASIANIEAGRQKIMLHQLLAMTRALKLRSPSELIPTDLVLGEARTAPADLLTTGSPLSTTQKKDLARIMDAFEDLGI